MVDMSRGSRPLSPHLTVYKPEWTMALSIFHRITGVAMMLAAAMISWWFLAAAGSPEHFSFVDGLLTSWIGNLILFASLFALCYHSLNGIRHLLWDAGYGLDLETAQKSALVVAAGSAGLTVLIAVLIWWRS
jgi:succinate dehydrogenase / fumarate reductase cytochrome b subunit